jgi:hypothetical protein
MGTDLLGWVLVAAGTVLALVGRHVFWLAVGIVGFLVTFVLAQALLPDLDPTVLVVSAVVIGVLGALVTIRSLRLVAAVAGGLLLAVVARVLVVVYVGDSAWQWLAFAAGLLVGVALVRWLFDIGIIVTTALGGGWYVAAGLGELETGLGATTMLWVGLGVAVVGAAVQVGLRRRSAAATATVT